MPVAVGSNYTAWYASTRAAYAFLPVTGRLPTILKPDCTAEAHALSSSARLCQWQCQYSDHHTRKIVCRRRIICTSGLRLGLSEFIQLHCVRR